MNPWKISTLFLTALLVCVVSLSLVQRSDAEPQPRMQQALEHLEKAKEHLSAASPDKGGHRVKALKLVQGAIVQVKKGMRDDNARAAQPDVPTP